MKEHVVACRDCGVEWCHLGGGQRVRCVECATQRHLDNSRRATAKKTARARAARAADVAGKQIACRDCGVGIVKPLGSRRQLCAQCKRERARERDHRYGQIRTQRKRDLAKSKIAACVVCGSEWSQLPGVKAPPPACCSRECRKIHARNAWSCQKNAAAKKPRPCKACGLMFVPANTSSRRRVFCSIKCVDDWGRDYALSWKRDHIDEVRARQRKLKRAQAEEHPSYQLWKNAEHRAKFLGLPFSITENDIRVPELCPILGIKLAKGRGKMWAGSPTLDRIVPALGYVPGNVAVISLRANRLKSDATPEELSRLAAWVASMTRREVAA